MQPLGFLLLIFVPSADFRKKVRKPPPNGSLPLQGLCLPDSELHLATRGATGADTAVFYISGTSGVCSISLPSKYSANTSAFFSAVSCRERCA